MTYKLKSGKVLSDADIEAMAAKIDEGDLPGEWSGGVVRGRPRLANEMLDVLTFKVPHSASIRIDEAARKCGGSRSAFLREAAMEKAAKVLSV